MTAMRPYTLCNAIPVRISLNDDYTTNWGIIENACSTTTAMIIINNPHNPTERCWHNLILKLWNLLQKYPKIIVLSDEVYEYITLKKSTYQRIHALNY
jgi:methionine aminotransferase